MIMVISNNFKAIGQLVIDILPLKRYGGYRKYHHKCSLGVNQVTDNFVILLQILHLYIKFKNNRTIADENITF